jgi:DNA-binding CsgD family transcriptional regulator
MKLPNSMEFYTTPIGDIMIHDTNGVRLLSESDRHFVTAMMCMINELYPGALVALSEQYAASRRNIPYYEYLIVRRFIKCNWGKFDSMLDIDGLGYCNFEEVECPLRGECQYEGRICRPKFNSELTARELEVMEMYYRGKCTESIATRLCISIETVKKHKSNVLTKLKLHSLNEFNAYAVRSKMFESK